MCPFRILLIFLSALIAIVALLVSMAKEEDPEQELRAQQARAKVSQTTDEHFTDAPPTSDQNMHRMTPESIRTN